MADTLDTYADAKGISKALGLSRSGIYSLIRRGILPQGARVGGSRRWRVADVRDALTRCEIGELIHE